jgi:hypothetical protein
MLYEGNLSLELGGGCLVLLVRTFDQIPHLADVLIVTGWDCEALIRHC